MRHFQPPLFCGLHIWASEERPVSGAHLTCTDMIWMMRSMIALQFSLCGLATVSAPAFSLNKFSVVNKTVTKAWMEGLESFKKDDKNIVPLSKYEVLLFKRLLLLMISWGIYMVKSNLFTHNENTFLVNSRHMIILALLIFWVSWKYPHGYQKIRKLTVSLYSSCLNSIDAVLLVRFYLLLIIVTVLNQCRTCVQVLCGS